MLTNFILTFQKNFFFSTSWERHIFPRGSYLQMQSSIRDIYIPALSIFFKEKYLIKTFPEEGGSQECL